MAKSLRNDPKELLATFKYRSTRISSSLDPNLSRVAPLFLAFIVGLFALDGAFVYDDVPSIVKNPTFESSVPFSAVFETDIWGSPLDEIVRGYRPLTNLLWKGIWTLFPDNPLPFRLLTAVLHLLATLALMLLVSNFTKKPWVTATTGFLFAVHSVHSEALGGITWQSDVLSSCAGFWALALVFPKGGWLRILGMTGLLMVAIGTKESGFLFALAAALAALANTENKKHQIAIVAIGALLAALAISIQLSLDRSGGAMGTNNLLYGASIEDRLLLGFATIGKGLSLCFVPHNLTPSHGYAATDLSLLTLLPMAIPGAFFLVVGLVAGARSILKHDPGMVLILCVLFGPILLQSGLLVPIQTDLAERLLYPASAGSCVLLGLLLSRVPGPLKTGIITLGVGLMLAQAWGAQRAWTHDHDLWARAIQVKPQAIRTQENHGESLLQQGKIDEGAWHLLVGTYLRTNFPNPVDWSHMEALTKVDVRNRLIEAPARLTYPQDPCPLLNAFLTRMNNRLPQFTQVTRPFYQRSYPVCFRSP